MLELRNVSNKDSSRVQYELLVNGEPVDGDKYSLFEVSDLGCHIYIKDYQCGIMIMNEKPENMRGLISGLRLPVRWDWSDSIVGATVHFWNTYSWVREQGVPEGPALAIRLAFDTDNWRQLWTPVELYDSIMSASRLSEDGWLFFAKDAEYFSMGCSFYRSGIDTSKTLGDQFRDFKAHFKTLVGVA